jgi:hypothetical protein
MTENAAQEDPEEDKDQVSSLSSCSCSQSPLSEQDQANHRRYRRTGPTSHHATRLETPPSPAKLVTHVRRYLAGLNTAGHPRLDAQKTHRSPSAPRVRLAPVQISNQARGGATRGYPGCSDDSMIWRWLWQCRDRSHGRCRCNAKGNVPTLPTAGSRVVVAFWGCTGLWVGRLSTLTGHAP